MFEPTPEFSRPLTADRLPAAGVQENLTAKPAERAALAKRFDLLDLPALTAQLTVKPQLSGTIAVAGTIHADVVQSCIVTLEPVAAHLDIAVDMMFVPGEEPGVGHEASESDMDASESEVDYFANGKIDIGEMVAQYLGVNLDAYPRKSDAALPALGIGAGDSETGNERTNPFARLALPAKNGKNKGKTSN